MQGFLSLYSAYFFFMLFVFFLLFYFVLFFCVFFLNSVFFLAPEQQLKIVILKIYSNDNMIFSQSFCIVPILKICRKMEVYKNLKIGKCVAVLNRIGVVLSLKGILCCY